MEQDALESFLVENPELELLSDKLADFNMFDVLRASGSEIRHSNVLAWLLDPRGTHNLGDAFLRRFISRVLSTAEREFTFISASRAELIDVADVVVEREWKNIDILVRSDKNKLCLVVENKVYAKESRGQLRRYFEAVQQSYPGYGIVPIFLTLEGDDPSEDGLDLGFTAFSHGEVSQIIGQLLGRFQARLPTEVAHLLSQYHTMLRRITMQDEELVKLCRDIYKKHKRAIDLIVEYGGSAGSSGAIVDALKKVVSPPVINALGHRVFFLTKELVTLTPEVGTTWESYLGRKSPWTLWLRKTKNQDRLKICFEVGQFPDPSERQRLLKLFEESGFKFWDGAYRDNAKFTRVYSEYIKAPAGKTIDEIDEADFEELIGALWKKCLPHLAKIEAAVKAFGSDGRTKLTA